MGGNGMDKVFTKSPTLCEVLREKIRGYKRAHPRYSSSQIARRWGLSASTFNRIENMDIRTPTIDQAIRILKGTGTNKEVVEFIKEYYPDIHSSLFGHFQESNSNNIHNNSVEEYLKDESTYKMMMFASSSNGLSEQYILDEFGNSGHKTFMKLAKEGCLINKDGSFYTKDSDYILSETAGLKVAHFQSKNVFENIQNGKEGKYKGYVTYESINLDKIRDRLNEIIDDFNFEINKVLKDPKNRGTDLFVSSYLATHEQQRA